VSDQVDVRNLDAVRDARAAIAEYRENARRALAEAAADAERSVRFIVDELRMRWEQERRRQERQLNHLKSELARAELQAQGQGGMVSVREEKARVERCRRAIEHATHKLARIRHWSAMLERELGMFKGQTQNLGRLVEGDLKRAEAELALTERRLEEYLRPDDVRRDPRAGGPPGTPATESSPPPEPAPDAPDTPEDRP